MSARAELGKTRRLVVKVGSALLAQRAAAGDETLFARLAREVAALRDEGREVVVVSSGAIALGWPLLGYAARPRDLAGLQAAAAAGQGRLISRWAEAFGAHGIEVAQVLLTHGDLEHRRRYLNARHALLKLLERGAVPIINENDTVSVDEIKLGDNDVLAAAAAGLTSSSLVVLLTGADGFYTADPSSSPDARRLDVIDELTPEIWKMAGPPAAFGTGGMPTKLRAAEAGRAHGAATVIAPGGRPGALAAILNGEDVGTLIRAPGAPGERAYKRWIATALRARGVLVVDAGAARALRGGASLLAAGVREVKGNFEAGDPVDVALADQDAPFARGLVACSAHEARSIAGRRSEEVKALLGEASPDELIHRDDLVLLGGAASS